MLDTRRDTDTVYIVDSSGIKHKSFLYENSEQDLTFEPQEMKTIEIRFNNAYHSKLSVKKMCFEDIIDYDEYRQNGDIESETLEIEM